MANTMQAIVRAKAEATAVRVVRGAWLDAMFYQRGMAMDFWAYCMGEHNIDVMDCGWITSGDDKLYCISFKVQPAPQVGPDGQDD